MKTSQCEGPFRPSNATKFITVIGLLMACTACTDPKAVQTFAAMAPDPAMVQGLTQIYVAELGWSDRLDLGQNVKPNAGTENGTAVRTDQAKGIVNIDTGIREYTKALGALAADSVVQSSSNVDDLTTGLTALQKAGPQLGLNITSADVDLITGFLKAITKLAEDGYRNAKLSELIGMYDEPLQHTLSIQIDIVNLAIVPSIKEYRGTIEEKQQFLKRQPTTVHYLFDRTLSADQENADLQLKAAQAYAKALADIKTAHTRLYENRNDMLTKAMFERIIGPAQDAYNAFQDYQKAVATSAAK